MVFKALQILSVSMLLPSWFALAAGPIDYANFPDFKGNTIEVSETITVKPGEVFDGNGNLYKWIGAGDCSQKEGMPAMFEVFASATLKNVWMENAPDGIHIKGSDVTIDGIVNVDVCEDAISISKSKTSPQRENITIINSKFYACEDKAIQLTRGNGIVIKNNEFYFCAKAVRIKEDAKNILFENNKVFNSKHAIKVTGGKGLAKDNYFEFSKTGFWVEKGGELIDGGGNVFVDVEAKYKETENGKINRQSN
ncbi:pectate lyase [Thalassotalea litorea]|uniref:pectate lyase n=1 Tax=Thalassotalea litorea TaxID=2020715 RepID=UPI00373669E7